VRSLSGDPTYRRWIAAWVGGSALGIVNGIFRETALQKRLGERTADQTSAGSLVALLAVYFAALQRRWPIASRRRAVEIGTTWATLTVAFEFVFGHYVDGKSWDELLANYDVTEGRLWTAILLWIALGPAAMRELLGEGTVCPNADQIAVTLRRGAATPP
jgi:hypothetical protein